MNAPHANQLARFYGDPDLRYALERELEIAQKALMKDATRDNFEFHKGKVEALQGLLDRSKSFFEKPKTSKGTVEL